MVEITLKPDNELLDMMIADHNLTDPKYQVTSYWKEIASPLIEYFRVPENLINFRSAPIRTGIRSNLPSNPGRVPTLTSSGKAVARIMKMIPGFRKVVTHLEEIIKMKIKEQDNIFRQSLILSYLVIKSEDQKNEVLEDKLVGNPDDVAWINDQPYSYRLLGYQYLYSQAMKHKKNNKLGNVLELGSGYGGQAEVFLRKHPGVKYIAMDIPPWLYVAEVYLKALFPGQVLGYRQTREIKEPTSLLDSMKDKRIAIVPAWKWPYLNEQYDLFWNSKSLQEMNENMGHYINSAANSCRQIFLHAYLTSKKNVHSPAELRKTVLDTKLMNELMYEEDLFAGKKSMSMLFSGVEKFE